MNRADPPASNVPMVPAAAVRPTRVFHLLAGVSARRLRGASLLASLSLVVAILSLAAFSVLPWWSLLPAVVVLAFDLAWLRRRAVADRADRAHALARARGSYDGQAPAANRHFTEAQLMVESQPRLERELQPESVFEPENESKSESAPGVGTAATALGAAELPAEADPLGWDPVPVPPPTYTLKAKAEPPQPVDVPGVPTESVPDQCLSIEGLVYDYDLDELVERRYVAGA